MYENGIDGNVCEHVKDLKCVCLTQIARVLDSLLDGLL